MKRIHIAIGVSDIERSVEDYSRRLGCPPEVVVPGEYALWVTAEVNFSIRQSHDQPGTLRHLGWEDDTASQFTQDADVNGIVWERFSHALQAKEIDETWPGSTRFGHGTGV
jgi:catechol 2,3-dioxygenase-like lactoylglutathione lyase family enzyme